jgi:hypothetical protein
MENECNLLNADSLNVLPPEASFKLTHSLGPFSMPTPFLCQPILL